MNEQDYALKWIESGYTSIPNLFLKHYKDLGINETEAFFLLHVHAFLSSGKKFPTPDDFASVMTLSSAESMEMMQRLIQKGFLNIEEKIEDDFRQEYYTLVPLWKKLLLVTEREEEMESMIKEDDVNVFLTFEKEFARPLTPMECEMIGKWLDEDLYPERIILEALKEAVFSNKLNLRYIDRILFEWGKNGIRTVEQVKEHTKQFRKKQLVQKQQVNASKKTNIPTIANWLDL
ncbi:DnaD domain-containing protein [Massilibacterium senegalense]|uniref:DnaD domain-containing protein n=1 Tax=Massilibacterium senegalense TaxID=1632858 RepID=UPI0007835554|nr:DnaD domain-containing protein [Massilibacterium senegalense]